MWIEFFVLGGLWSYALLMVAFILCLITVETNATFSTVVVIGTIMTLTIFGDAHPLTWLVNNKEDLFWYILGYFIFGTVWAGVKWYFYVHKLARIARQSKLKVFKAYNLENSITEIPQRVYDSLISEFRTQLGVFSKYRLDFTNGVLSPQVLNHKRLIVAWMTWWPVSGLWTLINDPIVRFFGWIYEQISDGLQRISDHAFADLAVIKVQPVPAEETLPPNSEKTSEGRGPPPYPRHI